MLLSLSRLGGSADRGSVTGLTVVRSDPTLQWKRYKRNDKKHVQTAEEGVRRKWTNA